MILYITYERVEPFGLYTLAMAEEDSKKLLEKRQIDKMIQQLNDQYK